MIMNVQCRSDAAYSILLSIKLDIQTVYKSREQRLVNSLNLKNFTRLRKINNRPNHGITSVFQAGTSV